MRFLHQDDSTKELTYEDLFLIPQFSDVNSRMNVDLRPVDGADLNIPIVVANMNAVAGRRMAETITRRGGLVILPQDLSIERIKHIVSYIKQCHQVFETPIVLNETETIQRALNLIHKRAHNAIIVVNDENRPVGIFMEKDARNRDRFTLLKDVMSRDMITMSDNADPKLLFNVIREKRIPILPIIKQDGSLAGVVTEKGVVRSTIYKPALNARNEFLTAVAIGINGDIEERLNILRGIGVDIFLLDTAHGHQSRMVDAVRRARQFLGDETVIISGNVVDGNAVRRLVEAGASIIKVGIGPGAMCTTRMMTGMGRPQFSAVRECAQVAREMGANVWADGGIRHPRDVVLALAAGASCAMIGSWWAGTYESAADIMQDLNGRLYKENFGMASTRAVTDRTRAGEAFDQARKKYFEEGISQSKMYLKEGEESAEDIIDKITSGIRSACTYAGAQNLFEFYDKAVVGVQTRAGYSEGKPVEERW